jgi:hypothetical protein
MPSAISVSYVIPGLAKAAVRTCSSTIRSDRGYTGHAADIADPALTTHNRLEAEAGRGVVMPNADAAANLDIVGL